MRTVLYLGSERIGVLYIGTKVNGSIVGQILSSVYVPTRLEKFIDSNGAALNTVDDQEFWVRES